MKTYNYSMYHQVESNLKGLCLKCGQIIIDKKHLQKEIKSN